jgi:hypothetical protein
VAREKRALGWWLALAVPLLTTLATGWWFNHRTDANQIELQIPTVTLMIKDIYVGMLLVGICVLPMLVLLGKPASWIDAALCTLLFTAVASGLAWKRGLWFPYMGPTLPDGFFLVGHQLPMLIGPWSQRVLTFASCLAAGVLVSQAVSRFRASKPLLNRFELLGPFTIIHVLLFPIAPRPYDRYYIVFLPGILAFLATTADPARFCRRLALGMLLAFGLLSVITTRDWFTWTGATWKLGRRVLEHGYPAQDIEGGTDWDGWYAQHNAVRYTRQSYGRPLQMRGFALDADHFLFPELTGRYALSLAPGAATRTLDSEPFRLWLFREPHQVLFLEHVP